MLSGNEGIASRRRWASLHIQSRCGKKEQKYAPGKNWNSVIKCEARHSCCLNSTFLHLVCVVYVRAHSVWLTWKIFNVSITSPVPVHSATAAAPASVPPTVLQTVPFQASMMQWFHL